MGEQNLRRRASRPEWLEITEWDWTLLGVRGQVLHAVGSLTNAATADDDWHGDGTTACGRDGRMLIPGIFTRMSAKRCARCCEILRMPYGIGSPKNDKGCRPIVEGRLAAQAALARAFEDSVF